MKLLLILSILFSLTSCFQQSNSSTADDSSCSGAKGSEQFKEVCAIIVDKCIACHGDHNFSTANQEYQDEEKFLAIDGLVKPGDAVNSYFVKRIKNCGSGENADMPTGDDPISSEDCETIKDWINSL